MGNAIRLNPNEAKAVSKISDLAYREFGLNLPPEKSLMIHSRLKHRVKSLGFSNISEYQTFVCSENGRAELPSLISALTTNVSEFFREKHHFELMNNWLNTDSRDGVRIWSAGCSNGQEPYSIAHFVYSSTNLNRLKILATDIDTDVLNFAKRGTYDAQMLSGLDVSEREGLFTTNPANPNKYDVNKQLKKMITFKRLNLLDEWPMRNRFDIIFCRNVVIYFDTPTKDLLWPRFAENLRNGGLFFLGHSERINEPESFGFNPIGPNAYRLETSKNEA